LIQPPSITEGLEFHSLFEDIVSLSYIGDIRFKFKAENANKISNIVQGQLPYL